MGKFFKFLDKNIFNFFCEKIGNFFWNSINRTVFDDAFKIKNILESKKGKLKIEMNLRNKKNVNL